MKRAIAIPAAEVEVGTGARLGDHRNQVAAVRRLVQWCADAYGWRVDAHASPLGMDCPLKRRLAGERTRPRKKE
ncbi:MAG: hypothetical protein KDI71_09990 [Xanthomonadales bacterium]|nr:hypothetical protein [Xanthomonadales bacterium]